MSDFLPEDVVVDILSRLPAKSLIRFRCVSKVWNSLITCPTFISSHLNQSPRSIDYNNLPPLIVRQCVRTTHTRTEHYKLFLDTEEAFNEYQELEFPLKTRSLHYFWVLGYVKGLFCFFERDSHYLWNPSIRKSLTLPKPPSKVKSRFLCSLGFGFDTRTNDHKVVRIVFTDTKPSKEPKAPIVEVYSLNAGSWKISGGASSSFPLGSDICTTCYSGHFAPCLEGAVHFAAKGRRNSSGPFILSFDLGDEIFQKILLPNGMVSRESEIDTSVFGGLLSLFCYDGYAKKSCSIWIMKEYGVVDSWQKQFKVDLSGGITSVLCIQNTGHILVEAKSQVEWELCSYDPCSQQVKNLGIHGVLSHFYADTFEENLILLNKTDDAISRRGVSRKRKDRICGQPKPSSPSSGSDAMSRAQEEKLQKLRVEVEVLRSRRTEERQRHIEERERYIEERERYIKELERHTEEWERYIEEQQRYTKERGRLIDHLESMLAQIFVECHDGQSSSTGDHGPTPWASALSTDSQRVPHEFDLQYEEMRGKILLTHQAIAKMGPQQRADVCEQIKTLFPNIQLRDVPGNKVDGDVKEVVDDDVKEAVT